MKDIKMTPKIRRVPRRINNHDHPQKGHKGSSLLFAFAKRPVNNFHTPPQRRAIGLNNTITVAEKLQKDKGRPNPLNIPFHLDITRTTL